MADSIVGGLFGMTPESYQLQQSRQDLARAAELGQLDPMASARTSLIYGGSQLGRMLGGEDPQLRLISARNAVMREVDQTDPDSIVAGARKLAQFDPAGANALANLAREAQVKMSQVTKNLREGNAAMLTTNQRDAAGIADASGFARNTPEWQDKYKSELIRLTTKEQHGGEFERTLDSLNLPPEQKKALMQQRLNALLNNDPNGIKAITAQLGALQLQERQFKFDEEQKKSAAEKQTAITKLAGLENDIDESLTTAAKAIKLAPNSFVGAANQKVFDNIPWTDQLALKNLVSSLNSDKAIGTLQELKTQSRTGATGFGALNTKELQLVLDKTRALDPSDKMFKENLTTVVNGWQRIRQNAIDSRENLQGKSTTTTLAKDPEAWISANMNANKSYSREDVIREGIKARRLPANYK